MAQEIIKSQDETKVAKIKYDSEFSEYQVRLYYIINGKSVLQEKATYFANDIEDARATAQAMVN